MLKKFFKNLKSIGLKKTIIKSINYLSFKSYKRRKLKKKIFSIESIEGRFNEIYQNNFWLGESRSGTGSTLDGTKNIRHHLPKLLEEFKITKLLDAPCGDFNWMSHVLKKKDINYLGADIVEDLIFKNKQKYENDKIKFTKLDIRLDELPDSDLMICRDCLFHFSYKDISQFFKNFLSSKIDYLLLTSHLNDKPKFKNEDIVTGGFRLIDFFSEPFNFDKNYLFQFDDRESENQNFKQMYLFSKSQIKDNLDKNCEKIFS